MAGFVCTYVTEIWFFGCFSLCMTVSYNYGGVWYSGVSLYLADTGWIFQVLSDIHVVAVHYPHHCCQLKWAIKKRYLILITLCFSLNNFFTVGTWKVSGVNFGHLLAACLNNPISNIHHIDFMVLSFNKQCPINYIYCAPVWTIPVFLEVPIRVTNKMTGCITMTYVHAHYDGTATVELYTVVQYRGTNSLSSNMHPKF